MGVGPASMAQFEEGRNQTTTFYWDLDDSVKERAKQFFRREFTSHFLTELDMFALWPPESQDPPYFWNIDAPRNYTYQGELLWLVPLDNDGDIFIEGNATIMPYPEFSSLAPSLEKSTAADAKANQQIRYIGSLAPDGELILLGWYDIKEGRYHIPYTKTLGIDFKTPDPPWIQGGQKPLKSGKWAYFPLPAEGLRVQTGPINYSFKAIEAILTTDPHS